MTKHAASGSFLPSLIVALALIIAASVTGPGQGYAQDIPRASTPSGAPAAERNSGSSSRPDVDPVTPVEKAPDSSALPEASPATPTGGSTSARRGNPPTADSGPPVSQDAQASPSSSDSRGMTPPGMSGSGHADVPPAARTSPRNAALPHDLSPMGMFLAADWVVKAVMIGLAFASLVTWTILVAKGLEIAFAKQRATAGVKRLARAGTLAEALNAGKRRWRGPVAMLAGSADEERLRSEDLSADGIRERVSVGLSRIEAGAGRSISRGTGLLATIGSTAPFVGLFGTVWGIMNAFIGISQANTTNLAVVAPGIAEALLATAIGLVAAIPAVIIYNVFARSIAGYRAILSDGSALVLQHLSRDLDRRSADRRLSPRIAEAAE